MALNLSAFTSFLSFFLTGIAVLFLSVYMGQSVPPFFPQNKKFWLPFQSKNPGKFEIQGTQSMNEMTHSFMITTACSVLQDSTLLGNQMSLSLLWTFFFLGRTSLTQYMTLWCYVYWSHSLIWKKTQQISQQQSAKFWMHSHRWHQYYNCSAPAGLWSVLKIYFWINCSTNNHLFILTFIA